jgi:hypothetical protein
LAATGKPLSATTTVPTPFSVRPGSVVWVIFAQSVGAPVVYQTALPPSGCMGTPSSIADGRCDIHPPPPLSRNPVSSRAHSLKPLSATGATR